MRGIKERTMRTLKHLDRVFQSAEEIQIDDRSRIILMSDVHRGDGSWADDFSKNQNIYYAALNFYNREKFTYIEIGDGDELWETFNFEDIMQAHRDVFSLLYKFYEVNRLYLIYGNHDMVKESEEFTRPLNENIKFYEGLVLNYDSEKIFLVHGHQVDCLNYKLWKLTRLLVRYLWKPLELLGINDPTSTAKNYEKKESVEKRLTKWAIKEDKMIITGHTHRPMFPNIGAPLYFNDGSCVHPRGITGIEIAEGNMTLVKWSVKTRDDGTLYIGREAIAGPRKLEDYFDGTVRKTMYFDQHINRDAIVDI